MIEIRHDAKTYRVDLDATPPRVYVIYSRCHPYTGLPVGQVKGLSPTSRKARAIVKAARESLQGGAA